MQKNKIYLIGFIAVLILSMAGKIYFAEKKIEEQKAEIERVQGNNANLMAENRQITNLQLRSDELNGTLSKAVDSLSKQLKIKPKYIDRIVYVDIYTRDTVKVPVYVTITGKGQWNISDSSKCFKWAGIAYLKGDSLKVDRTLYENTNKITEVFYKQRSRKFLFIKFGKWQYQQHISSSCDSVKIKNIEFLH